MKKEITQKNLEVLASSLLAEIMLEELPNSREPTYLDIKFKEALIKLDEVSPGKSDYFRSIYNFIQKKKISPKDEYYKRLRKKDEYY